MSVGKPTPESALRAIVVEAASSFCVCQGEARRRVSEACKILNLLPRRRFLRLLNLGLPASACKGSILGEASRVPSKHTEAERLGAWLSDHVCDAFATRFPNSCGFDSGRGGLCDAAPGSAGAVGGGVSGCVGWLATAEMSALFVRALHAMASSQSAPPGRPSGGDGGVSGEGLVGNGKGEAGGVGKREWREGDVGEGLIARCGFARDCLLLHQHLCAMDPQLQVECVLL